MGVAARAVRTRQDLEARLLQARARTDEVFRIVREDAMYERPIAERHRIIFYLGHVESFDWNLLAQRAFGLQSFHPTFDKLFAFGIDPVDGGLPADQPSDWPRREEIERYKGRLRFALDEAIHRALANPGHGHPQLLQMLEVAIEHRLMHAETLAYMLHQLPADKKVPAPKEVCWKTPRAKSHLVDIPSGYTTLGLAHVTGEEFGWDNEFQPHDEYVSEFAIENYNVTNRDYMLFLESGGYANRSLWDEAWDWKEQQGIQHPAFWRRAGNLWLYRTMFGECQLPLDWPVYVSHAEASAYAKWMGRKLPTEEQFHRAAYGTSDEDGVERQYPWGDEPPSSRYGNFDFAHWDPTPVASYPRGASAFGVHDLLGNGWEWTRTKFAPFPGFAAMPFYSGYSANFFDDKHYVMKGGSPRTAACMLRRSFRNWFQPHYPYVYATFRCVED
jgi:gamma-glutamyl hercynylcysteine S-oxide synthase